MGDEEDLRKRNDEYIKDRREQAKWYESLNLYAEALKIFRSIEDEENVQRLESKMKREYVHQARIMEKEGRVQQAANLYFLIGDLDSVGRLKKIKPDLVIMYDQESGGLSKMIPGLEPETGDPIQENDLFQKQNVHDDFEVDLKEGQTAREEPIKERSVRQDLEIGSKGVPVKMPKNRKKMRFCPYCGEKVATKKDPRFCPFCGEELA